MPVVDEVLVRKFDTVFPHLDERQRRIYAAAEARALGRGGIARVVEASGLSRSTVQRAMGELDRGFEVSPRIRRPGAGRKPIVKANPALVRALEALVDPGARGDPESPLRWTIKSTRQLAHALTDQGHAVSHSAVADLLHALGYSLQANIKTQEGAAHPDRDAQFSYLAREVGRRLRRGEPVISVDTKKKELVGQFKNAGQTWRPKGDPEEVAMHDFADPALGKAIPYGVYDVGANTGWVVVGTDHDTAEFAVATIWSWWETVGGPSYPEATRLLVCADGGGSNGYRVRLWKVELHRLAAAAGLDITVCHFPPGASKWNKIEHRLFSHISMNWRGRPLTSHEVIVDLIGSTTTRQGLKVRASLDPRSYPTRTKITDEQLAAVPITRHRFHGEWNYTIHAQARTTRV
ncbi:MAG TPA: ISAzo13 family transposase [Actinomycetota bacterium]|nr:ISAzo13 family transposase [Actinomycetota bacterium]